MKFSVIVPVYNVQQYIRECCDSVLAQSYQNYELILVDDGSSDHSGTICDQIAEAFPGKCICLHTVNLGPLIARQTGIRAATGDALVFVDSDDCLRPDTLELLSSYFQNAGCDLALYNASDKNDYSHPHYSYPFRHGTVWSQEEKSSLYQTLVLSKIPNSVCLKAARKHCFVLLPDFTSLSYVQHGEDLLMSLYMMTAAKKIVYLDENLYFYRQREGSIVHSFHPGRVGSIKTVHEEMERFIDMWQMPELHPAHYAREVHGWIETLLILMENKKHMEAAQFRLQLQSMAQDPYFLRAYDAMDPSALSGLYRLLAKWLHDRQYVLLSFAVFLKKIKSKLKVHL